MARLITASACDALDPLAEVVALLDVAGAGQFEILKPPAGRKPGKAAAAKLDRSPDAFVWFWSAESCVEL